MGKGKNHAAPVPGQDCLIARRITISERRRADEEIHSEGEAVQEGEKGAEPEKAHPMGLCPGEPGDPEQKEKAVGKNPPGGGMTRAGRFYKGSPVRGAVSEAD